MTFKKKPYRLVPLKHLIRVMRRHDLTKKNTMTKTKTKKKDKDKDNDKDKYI